MSERDLWRSVLLRAFEDADMSPTNSESRVIRARARAWFSVHSADFHAVCSYAGYDPGYVLAAFANRMAAA